ncbi:hypothetical protein Q3G72_033435 [Acer saccharum]|nr:hypothetical protein Q3G72_033435 [Acer saccharum]
MEALQLMPGWAVKAIMVIVIASIMFCCVFAATNHTVRDDRGSVPVPRGLGIGIGTETAWEGIPVSILIFRFPGSMRFSSL